MVESTEARLGPPQYDLKVHCVVLGKIFHLFIF